MEFGLLLLAFKKMHFLGSVGLIFLQINVFMLSCEQSHHDL